ncbi:MAG: SiaB family protein kinase [Bacteroidota bacterium]
MIETTDRATLLFNWFEECEKENIILSFKGDFNQDLVNAILMLAEREPDVQSGGTVPRARVFSIMVECMQNIRKYGAVNEAGSELKPGIILVCRDKNGYSIKTGNLIVNAEVGALKERLENITRLNKDELKVLHKKVLSETQLSEKSGAGLGLISMARKCDGFSYKFQELNERVNFYSLDILVSTANR